MKSLLGTRLSMLIAAIALAPLSLAQHAFGTVVPQDVITPYVQDVAGHAHLSAFAVVSAQPGDRFAVFATPRGQLAAQRVRVAQGIVSPTGSTVVSWPIERPPVGAVEYDVFGVFRGVAGNRVTTPVKMWTGVRAPGTDAPTTLDFNTAPGGPLQRGEFVSSQYLSLGVQIGAVNNNPAHPNAAIVFDSAGPTGGDFDLATPGYGPGNMAAFGNLLIIAEDQVDVAPADGYVDDPDDEAGGGVVTFRLGTSPELNSVTLVDIDDANPSTIILRFSNMSPPKTIPVPNLGDNSVQTLMFQENDCDQVEVYFGGSGAIAQITFGAVPPDSE